MPLTPFQSEVLGVLAANRREESYFAGGMVLHASPNSARYSHDFDIFHEAADEVTRASEADSASLRAVGLTVEPQRGDWTEHATFRKAKVYRGTDSVGIDWAADSAFRFFPIELDPVALKTAWIEMSDRADAEMTLPADTQPDMLIGVAFVDAHGHPGWIGDDSTLKIHEPCVRGCLPRLRGL